MIEKLAKTVTMSEIKLQKRKAQSVKVAQKKTASHLKTIAETLEGPYCETLDDIFPKKGPVSESGPEKTQNNSGNP